MFAYAYLAEARIVLHCIPDSDAVLEINVDAAMRLGNTHGDLASEEPASSAHSVRTSQQYNR